MLFFCFSLTALIHISLRSPPLLIFFFSLSLTTTPPPPPLERAPAAILLLFYGCAAVLEARPRKCFSEAEAALLPSPFKPARNVPCPTKNSSFHSSFCAPLSYCDVVLTRLDPSHELPLSLFSLPPTRKLAQLELFASLWTVISPG